MARNKVHYIDSVIEGDYTVTRSLCGMMAFECTDRPEDVTCAWCTKKLRKPIPFHQRPRPLSSVGAVDSNGVRFDDPNRIGCTVELRIDDRIANRRRWRTWQSAVTQMHQWRDDGYPIKSTSDPGRFEGLTPGKAEADGDRAQRVAGEFAIVSKLIDEAYRNAIVLSEVPRRVIGQKACELVLELCTAGAPRPSPRPRQELSRPEIASLLEAVCGFNVTAGDVWTVFRVGGNYVEEGLYSRGLISDRDMGLIDMVEINLPFDLDGWDEIAGALKMSVSAARRLQRRAEDPLPAKMLHGRIRAKKAELEAWYEREMNRAA